MKNDQISKQSKSPVRSVNLINTSLCNLINLVSSELIISRKIMWSLKCQLWHNCRTCKLHLAKSRTKYRTPKTNSVLFTYRILAKKILPVFLITKYSHRVALDIKIVNELSSGGQVIHTHRQHTSLRNNQERLLYLRSSYYGCAHTTAN